MEFGLKGALKKYRRMRAWRRFGLALMPVGAGAAAWVYDLGRTDTLICVGGALLFFAAGELELRLKTIQIRLAGMSDRLNRLTGGDNFGDPNEDLISELNDW